MAENASAQSGHVSSSHGTESGAKSGACCDSSGTPPRGLQEEMFDFLWFGVMVCECGLDLRQLYKHKGRAPSLPEKGIESTEKVDVFQAAEVDYYMTAAPGVTPNASDLLFSRHKSPYSTLVSGESGEPNQSMWEDASKEGEKPTVYGDQKEKWNMTVTAPTGLKILMLSEHEQYIKTSEADGLFQSSSQASVSEKTCSDLESPSSPFEVLVGKTEFSNSSADSSGYEGKAGTFVEKGWLMNSWSSDPYESSGARTAGNFPVGPPSYESVTRQATAVNSLDFQGLTSHILSDCDMTSKVFLAGDVGQLNDSSTDFQRVGLFDLSPEVMPKITPYKRGHDHFHSQLGKPEDAMVYSQAKAIGMQKEALQFGKHIEKEVLAEADTVTGYKTHLSEDSLFSPHLLNSFQATADSNWPDNAEMAEADSSGESDDTVIEDTKAGLTLIGKKAEKLESPEEAVEASKSGTEQILGEINLAGPFTLVLVPGQVKESESSPEELAYHEKSRLPYAIPEEDLEFMDDFETLQNPTTAGFDESEFSEQATSIKELSKSGVRTLEMPYTLSEFSRTSPAEVMREVEQSVQDKESFFLSFDKATGASDEHHDSIHGESIIDFRKKRNAKNSRELLETSAQVNEANVDAGKMHESATDLHVGRILMLKKLPLAETGTEGHGIFAQPGELSNKYTLHGGTVSGVKLQPSPASPEDSPEAAAFFLDLNQEQLTITALRELSTIPDESPVSAEESCSPSPKESSTFITADQLEETFVPYCETMSKVLLIKEEVHMLPAFPSTQFVHESRSREGSSGTKELTKERGFARLLTSCSVRDLVFWRDVKKSGMVFGTSLVLLLSLAAFSVISVIAYLILALLSVTISFRIYRSVIQAVQKSEEGHPFKPWLDIDISVSSEAFHNHVNTGLVYVNKALKQIIRLFLVQDLVDSLKLAVCMWLMTYVGAVFNGITLLILGLLMAFTVPIVYEKYQTQIDHYISIIREQSKAILAKVHAKLPGLAKKKAE